MDNILIIKDLHATVENKEILKGVNLVVKPGEIHALMGPNGTGKSTLSYVIAGHPNYKVTKGSITFRGEDVLAMKPDERSRAGLFLAFQHPLEINGVTTHHFLYMIAKARMQINPLEFRKLLVENAKNLGLDRSFLERQLNVGFSGGEKKRAEMLQMLTLKPSLAILDEVDSGTDVDSLQFVAKAINDMKSASFGALVITHYNRILDHIRPDYVHVLVDGRIVKTGDFHLAQELEQKGYQWLAQ